MFSAIWLLRKICKIIIAKIRKIIWSGQLAKGNRSRILNQVQTFCTSSLYLTQLWLQVTDLSGRCQILRLSSLWRPFASRHQIHSDMKVFDCSSWKILRFFSKLPLSPLEDSMSICHNLSLLRPLFFAQQLDEMDDINEPSSEDTLHLCRATGCFKARDTEGM